MKNKNKTHTLIIEDGIEVTKVDEFLFSLDKIEKITPAIKISDYLKDSLDKNLNNKR